MNAAEQISIPSSAEDPFELFTKDIDPDIGSKLGAYPIHTEAGEAIRFNVWAPAATQISVVGDFNNWNPESDPLFPVGETGIWTTLIMNASQGCRYQYRILDQEHQLTIKSDPFARQYAQLPDHSSIVKAELNPVWHDALWMERRRSTDLLNEPISIYELHLGSWSPAHEQIEEREPLYRRIAEPLINYLKKLEFTHVLFMPLMEHPFDGSWGYQVTGFFAPTSRYGTPEDLTYLIDQLHQHGIGAIFDWVPAHFPKDSFGLSRFDGSALFEYACPKQAEHPDWGTAIFDYNKPQVVSFLISSALTWIRDFHFDGIRVDAVASMIYRDYSRPSGDWTPNVQGGHENLEAVRFLQSLNRHIGDRHPGVLRIAEESTAWPGVTHPVDQGGLGFDLKWNLGWMHDSLTYFSQSEEQRPLSQTQPTLPSLYQHAETYCLPFSHDEVVHEKGSMLNKMPGTSLERKARHLCALYSWMFAWPGKKLLFMGAEFGHIKEWDQTSTLDWNKADAAPHRGIHNLVSSLNRSYRKHPSMAVTDNKPECFFWLVSNDIVNAVFAFMRRSEAPEDTVLCIGNFSSHTHLRYRVGVPLSGQWQVSINSSWTRFQGDQGDTEQVIAAELSPEHSQPFSLSIDLPECSTLHLKPIAAPHTA